MRLTLRTMLAYMDDILEPEDHASIGARIKESEFATQLVNRCRDVTRRMRLGAPQLTGRGMGLDPNTVAEYLDNTLPHERIADFEKVCLESDVHLAEAAACHQILTLVLGEPAEIDPASRERMYHIPARAEQATAAPPHQPSAAAVSTRQPSTNGTKRRKREVPDYLRESRRSRRKPIIAMLAVALIGAIVTAAILKPELLSEFLGTPDEVVDGGSEAPPFEPPKVDLGVETTPGTPEVGTVPGIEEEAKTPDRPLVDEPEASPPPAERPAVEPTPEDNGDAQVPPMPSDEPIAKTPLVRGPTPPEPVAPSEQPEAQPEPTIGSGDQVGIYVSPTSVLLRYDPQAKQWQRLPSRAALAVGDRLLALPTFRPALTLSAGVTLQLAGGSSIVLLPPDAEGTQGVDLQFGKIIVSGVGADGSRLRLQFGDMTRSLFLGDAESTLAVQLTRTLPPGIDPEKGNAPITVDLYAASGHLQWEIDGQTTDVRAPAHWQLGGTLPPAEQQAAALPGWIDEEPVTLTERRASLAMEESLSIDRPVGLSLSEQVNRRRSEVRSLAARCAVYVGQFQPFIAALNDTDQRAVWFLQIEALRSAMALSPEVATTVREAFARHRGQDGPALYRMLWGYNPEQLSEGADKQLVELLDHEVLDFRVLAFWNLKTITGLGLNYRPEYTSARRRHSVQAWKQRLEEGSIQPASADEEPPEEAASAEADSEGPEEDVTLDLE